MRSFQHLLTASFLGACLLSTSTLALAQDQVATGYVFHDANGNGQKDEGEQGLRDVAVSNGRQVVKTNESGQYSLPVTDDTGLFVIKPRNWSTVVDALQIPRFYYLHKPAGSPEVHFKGVQPTGALPTSIDFPLTPTEEGDEFKVIFFGDTQSRNVQEVEYMTHDVIEPILNENGHGATFGVTLGDIVFDDLNVFEPTLNAISKIGLPWYNVLGNHDMNYDAQHDDFSDETFERILGPSHYSYNYGPVHFIVLNNVRWIPGENGVKGRYDGHFGEKQIEFVKNSLEHVPADSLVVLMMHIPLVSCDDHINLFGVIQDRPNTLSLSAHTHQQRHHFVGKDQGWQGQNPHHHYNHGTVCGSWWSGAPDEYGIPHALMSDGTPNGYSIATFTGNQYKFHYQVARKPASYQMQISVPDQTPVAELANTDLFINVFNGSEKNTVEYSFDNGQTWLPSQKVAEQAPEVKRIKELETTGTNQLPGRKLPNPAKSSHLWKSKLPTSLTTGWHKVLVRTTDMHGQTFRGERVIQIIE